MSQMILPKDVDSKFRFITVAAQRAKQLQAGAKPRVETRRLTQRRSPSSQKRWVCRLGRKRRRFLLLAWETRLPTATLLPVTSQTRLIKVPTNQ